MSYFDKCEDCGKPFKERSYTWSVCADCLRKEHPEEFEYDVNGKSTTEKLMNDLTDTLSGLQNDLFSIITEQHCAVGIPISELETKYFSEQSELSKDEINKVFDCFKHVMVEHELESKRTS